MADETGHTADSHQYDHNTDDDIADDDDYDNNATDAADGDDVVDGIDDGAVADGLRNMKLAKAKEHAVHTKGGYDPRFYERHRKLVKAEEHTVHTKAGYDPRYYAISVCRDGRVILCDNKWISGRGRNYLRLYNPATRTKQELRLRYPPRSDAQLDDTHLALSSPYNKTITIVSIGNELRVEKNLKTQYGPWRMVALNNGQLAVTWVSPPAFGVIDVSGTQVVEKLYMDRDTDGRTFGSLWNLAVDERRQHVIQSCDSDTAVYCFDFNGNPVFKYSHPRLASARGVALDKYGNIYVSAWGNCSIHKLSPTGDLIDVIKEGVPHRPLAICSDVTGTGFWMTRGTTPHDQVVYLRLQYMFKDLCLRELRSPFTEL